MSMQCVFSSSQYNDKFLFKTENLNESHHNVTHIMDEKTADRSKQGYVNLSEYDNIGASPSPRPSAISKLMKPVFALKGKPYQEYLDNSNSGEKDLFDISIT